VTPVEVDWSTPFIVLFSSDPDRDAIRATFSRKDCMTIFHEKTPIFSPIADTKLPQLHLKQYTDSAVLLEELYAATFVASDYREMTMHFVFAAPAHLRSRVREGLRSMPVAVGTDVSLVTVSHLRVCEDNNAEG